MGLMPAYRCGPDAGLLAEGGLHRPGQPRARPRQPPGLRRALRRRDRRAARARQRRRDHRRPHRGRVGGRDAAARPARGSTHARDPRRRRRRHGRISRRCAPCSRSSASASGAGRRDAAELEGVEEAATAEEALARRRRRRHGDVVAPEPVVRREWLADGAHVNAVGSSIPSTRELDTRDHGRRRAVRRPARVDAQRVGRLPLPARRRRDRRPTTSAARSASC